MVLAAQAVITEQVVQMYAHVLRKIAVCGFTIILLNVYHGSFL